jgi:thiosulfate/3-mercaptopyruvate sulfurtransferase
MFGKDSHMAIYANPEALMSTEELAMRLTDPALAVIEVDEDTTAYEKSHIPGAIGLNWRTDLQAAPRRDFVSSQQLGALLGAHGVGPDQTIVLYGGNNNWFAAYAYWLFLLRGVRNLRLLNGGRIAWELQGRATTADVRPRKPTTYVLGEPAPRIRVLRDIILAGPGATLVDVRSPAEFAGELLAPAHLPQEQSQVPGHIPGAVNIPWSKAANEDGTFKSPEDLRSLYEGAGVLPDAQVVTYCRIGERSAYTWFVLTELLGYPNVRNYDGSWTEYGSLVGVPVELGAA